MFLAADVSSWGLGIAVAAIGLFGTIIAALTSRSASRRQTRSSAEATERQARSSKEATERQGREGVRERTAKWQLYKRDVYAELLAAARALCSATDNKEQHQTSYFAKYDKALLCAEPDLREKLRTDFADPLRVSDEGRWDEFVDALGDDGRYFGKADSKEDSKESS
jgi:hypothetical protein